MRRSILLLTSLLATATPRLILAQRADSGGYVTRLGLDTIAVETFVRTKDRLEGTRISRSPTTTSIHYVATLNKAGQVSRFEAELRDGGTPAGAPRWTSVTSFGPTEVVTTFNGAEGVRTIRNAPHTVVLPLLTNCYALYEQALRLARRAGGRDVQVEWMYPGQDLLTPTTIRQLGHDSATIESYHGAHVTVRMDHDGRLLSYDATATVVKVQATRVAQIDLPSLQRQFVAADSTGRGVGQISSRDTARIALGGSAFRVDYGRPSKRGRTIYGGLVPWGQVWRTGANAATQLFVDREILIGELRLRPGIYSLWTIPSQDGATLIVNSESGQWGTDHDASRDIAKVPLVVRSLDQEVERFTIQFTPTSPTGAELHLQWDTTDWSVPVRLP